MKIYGKLNLKEVYYGLYFPNHSENEKWATDIEVNSTAINKKGSYICESGKKAFFFTNRKIAEEISTLIICRGDINLVVEIPEVIDTEENGNFFYNKEN